MNRYSYNDTSGQLSIVKKNVFVCKEARKFLWVKCSFRESAPSYIYEKTDILWLNGNMFTGVQRDYHLNQKNLLIFFKHKNYFSLLIFFSFFFLGGGLINFYGCMCTPLLKRNIFIQWFLFRSYSFDRIKSDLFVNPAYRNIL